MLWHTSHSLSTQLCAFSLSCPFLSYSFPLSFFYSNLPLSKISSPISLHTALFFSHFPLFLSQMTTQGSRDRSIARFRRLFNPRSELSSELQVQRKPSWWSLWNNPSFVQTHCSHCQLHGLSVQKRGLTAGSSPKDLCCFSEATIIYNCSNQTTCYCYLVGILIHSLLFSKCYS